MDPVFANIQKFTSPDNKIVSFLSFCEKVHELANCQLDTCEIKLFVGTLKEYLEDEEKTESDRRDFFISHCDFFKILFKSMFNLSLDKKYRLEVLEVLRKQQQKEQQSKQKI